MRYGRETKIKSPVPFDNGSEYVTWNYAESIQIDRESETVEIYRKIAEECDTAYRYHVAQGVSDFLDSLDTNFLFKDIPGEPEDVIEDPLERKTYHIEVDYENQPSLILDGDFFRHTLPDDWEEFASDLHDFTSFYDGSELLNPEVYEKAKRRATGLAFCSVEFAPGEKTYYYLDESDTCVEGDYVLVPVGSDGRTANVKVVNVEYYQPEEAPFPLNKIKRIIRKVGLDDLVPPIVRCPLLGKNIDESDCVKISNVAENVLSGEPTERYDEPIDWTYEKAEQCADCDNHPYI